MSNALALAGVTSLLKDLLNDGLINSDLSVLGGFEVTAQPPERLVSQEQSAPANRLNIFLYRVTPNTGWSNERLPSRSSSGERLTNPYLALDLHYLLSAFGMSDLHAEILLGYGMQLLHETPVLTRDAIRNHLTLTGAGLPSPFDQLDADELADQLEMIRTSPYHIDTEEMARLWSSLNTGIRPSSTYKVSVVLIESRRSTRSAPPVHERKLYVERLRRPRIERLLARPVAAGEFEVGVAITHAARIALVGTALRGPALEVRVGDVAVPAPTLVGPGRIEFDVPASLWPRIYGVQVFHRVTKEAPAVGLIPLEASNTIAFALTPSFMSGPAPAPIELTSSNITPAQPTLPVTGVVRVRFAHHVGVEQKVELLLNEVSAAPPAGRSAHAYTFAARDPAPGLTEVSELEFDIAAVERGLYLVRVRIEGTVSDVGFAPDMPATPTPIRTLAQASVFSDPVLDLT